MWRFSKLSRQLIPSEWRRTSLTRDCSSALKRKAEDVDFDDITGAKKSELSDEEVDDSDCFVVSERKGPELSSDLAAKFEVGLCNGFDRAFEGTCVFYMLPPPINVQSLRTPKLNPVEQIGQSAAKIEKKLARIQEGVTVSLNVVAILMTEMKEAIKRLKLTRKL